MRVGIFFGGLSREREISFAGGRTVYDSIDKKLFTPIPIFIDSFGQFILLNWEFIYKGSIRDFYPSIEHLQKDEFSDIQIYAESLTKSGFSEQELATHLGTIIKPDKLKEHIDFAFLALHGTYGEDGSIQGLLQYLNIPFSGSGIAASAIGMSKSFQKELLADKYYAGTKNLSFTKQEWDTSKKAFFESVSEVISFPLVVRPSNQGSSVGVGVVKEKDFSDFCKKVENAFFRKEIDLKEWHNVDSKQKKEQLAALCDIRSSIGLPLVVDNKQIHTPKELFEFLEDQKDNETVLLEALDGEVEVLIEEFIDGREFSCIVLRNELGKVMALPPTEIIKGKEVFDYRSKYLPGKSSKITPIDIADELIERIAESCIDLFKYLRFNVYARIDGFIKSDGTIILNDPNTTSGMLPSSFFFHQAAEVGLNPSQFITYIIRNSLKSQIETTAQGYQFQHLLSNLDNEISNNKAKENETKTVGVILGGYSSERHISVESGRNIYEKLASSSEYNVIPVFLTGDSEAFQLYQLPINVLLKDNADDIAHKVESQNKKHTYISKLRKQFAEDARKYLNNKEAIYEPVKLSLAALSEMVDFVFIALHGRPGEDGAIQAELEKFNIPYNGSQTESSSITIDKFKCNQLLKKHGCIVSDQLMVFKTDWIQNEEAFIHSIEKQNKYPFICKPADDGCSSAVKLIKNQKALKAFTRILFRDNETFSSEDADKLGIQLKEEMPKKSAYLVEKFITAEGAVHFLEITGGLLTHYNKDGSLSYEIFEPSEALSGTEILSLEEKFLAGEGQNITPARFSENKEEQKRISELVRKDLEQTARLLNVQGYARIDAFVRIFDDGKVETIIIEVNSLPGMTPATCIFHQTAINGLKPFDFIHKIIQFGTERNKRVVV